MLRELLYVDVTRCRSLVSQIDYGVVETIVEGRSQADSGSLSATLLGFKADWSGSDSRSLEQSRSLQDLLFTVFEEAVESQGILRTLDLNELSDPDYWQTSQVHSQLVEGELIKVFLPVGVVDPQFVADRFDRFIKLIETVSDLTERQVGAAVAALEEQVKVQLDQLADAARAQGKGKDEARKLRTQAEGKIRSETKHAIEKIRQEAASKAVGGLDMDTVKGVAGVLNQFLAADAMSVRFFACGVEHPDLAFVGSLLGRDEYIQRERDALFSRYGSTLEGWTSVLQVASIPQEPHADADKDDPFKDMDFSKPGGIHRPVLERGAMSLLDLLDTTGVSEGPMWPGISVVPLGIYRTVPRSDQVDQHDG